MEITDNQLKAICVIASVIIIIFLAIKTNVFEFILGNLKIKGKKNNPKENSDQNINPAIQANANKDSNVNIGGTQIIHSGSGDIKINLNNYSDYNKLLYDKSELIEDIRTINDIERKKKKILQLEEIEKEIINVKSGIIRYSETINQLKNEQISDQLKEIIELHDKKEFEKVKILLDKDELIKEQNNLQKDEDNLVSNKKINAKKFLIKAQLTSIEYGNQNSFKETCEFYEYSLKSYEDEYNLFEYAFFLAIHNQNLESLKYYLKIKEYHWDKLGLNSKARLLNNLGVLYVDENEENEALKCFKDALGIYRDLAKNNSETHNPNVAGTLNNLGDLYRRRNEQDEALKCLKEAIGLFRDLAKNNSEIYNPNLAGTLNNLGSLYHKRNEQDEALKCYKEAIGLYRDLAKNNSEKYNFDFAMALNNFGDFYTYNNKLDEALECYKEALGLYRDLAKNNSETHNPNVAMTLNNLGTLYTNRNEQDEALSCLKEALGLYGDLAKNNSETYNHDVAMTLNNLGTLYTNRNEQDEALNCYKEALGLFRDLGKNNSETYNPYVATILNNLGSLYHKRNEQDKAFECLKEALELRRNLAKSNSETYNPDLAATLNNLGSLYHKRNEQDEALKCLKEAYKIALPYKDRNPYAFQIIKNLTKYFKNIGYDPDFETTYQIENRD